MPLYHFTLHAYRSWNTDNPKGYIKRTKPGIQRLDKKLAAARNRLAKFPPVLFNHDDQKFLVEQSKDVVTRRGLTLYGVTAIKTHLHLIAGSEKPQDPDDIQSRLKRGFGFILAKRHGTQGRPYFSRGGAPERVKDAKHLRHLLDEYFPKHNGPMWRVELEKRN